MLAFEGQLIRSRLWKGMVNDLCEKIVLEAFLHVALKVFCFLVGVRKTSVSSSRLKQVFQKGNRLNVYVSTYILIPCLTLCIYYKFGTEVV